MSRLLVLYYSSYGHIEVMAQAIAQGARTAGSEVDIKRVPETAPIEVSHAAGFKLDQTAPIATISELSGYDGLILGVPTRYGRMPSQMAAFLDQAGSLVVSGALSGKIGAAFTSTASQHGGQETTLFSVITNLMHFGMMIVGIPYDFSGLSAIKEVHGGTPYGASTIADVDGSRNPSSIELEGARYQGRHVAQIANRLFG
jgi:NAD(P)H dehydrogenase (quinone)